MKRKIGVLSLGGTISMREASSGGIVPTLSGEELLEQFGVADPCLEVSVLSLRSLASAQLKVTDLLELAAKARELAPDVDGIVVTQGTDTIEETAFALDLWGPCDVPVVVTGAMRHPDAPGSDGAANFRDSIMAVSCESLVGLGAVVVMDGELHAARYVTKRHTATVRAFGSSPSGILGWVKEGSVDVLVDGLRPQLSSFALPCPRSHLPEVAVLKSWVGDDGRLASKLPEMGYAGVVVEGMGGGHVHPRAAESLEALCREMPVVISTRVVGSHVLRNTYGFIGSEIDLHRRGVMLGGWLTTGKLHLLMTAVLGTTPPSDYDFRQALQPFGGG
ncbi:asparaginase [Fodinicurvata fenggangensis]|uniref:asparaginase n=1 Tax=Fodinicurvata fenggangensis TaxID=1121830 RepID=UPI0006924D3C|nr:asparaginase [Fodinicurvata fenggangensis]